MLTLLPFTHLAILRHFSKSARWVFNFNGRHGTHLGKISLTLWEKIKQPNMSEKQPQILIFNAAGELVAIARSICSAAELTKVDENDIKLCCENRLSISGQYCFRYNVDPSIADDTLGKLTIDEYDKLCQKYNLR